ncbi:MAG: NfeD family protein [Candidatus Hydrogenedentes bacterium]|nr:NfeD family protein [Candidatus Hydrogenedentota bacterium]
MHSGLASFEEGVAATVLSPSGKVRVQGVTIQALSVAGYVPKGAGVILIGRRGGVTLCEPKR